MNLEKQKAIIEAILFAAGRVIKINEFMAILEISSDEVISIINKMQDDYKCENRGIEIIKVEDDLNDGFDPKYINFIDGT